MTQSSGRAMTNLTVNLLKNSPLSIYLMLLFSQNIRTISEQLMLRSVSLRGALATKQSRRFDTKQQDCFAYRLCRNYILRQKFFLPSFRRKSESRFSVEAGCRINRLYHNYVL